MPARTRVLLPLALAALASHGVAQVITVGSPVNVSRLTGSQSETAIAIDRTNLNRIALVSNNGGGLFAAYTANGGATWAPSSLSAAGSYDPWMGADSFGNLILSYQIAAVTYVDYSTTGGASYLPIQTIPGVGADHPEMAVGPGVFAGTNSIYLRDTIGGSSRVLSGVSTGLGTGSLFTIQPGLGAGNFGSTAVGPGGRTIFTAMNPSGGVGPASMTMRYDADGTGPLGYVVRSTVATNVGGFRPIPAQPSRSIDAQVALRYDFSGGAHSGDLYMLYTQAADTTTNDTDIVFRRSTDDGLSFGPELRLNDDTGTNSQFFGRLAVDETTGDLAAVWYDARNARGNDLVELYGSMSFNGGLTWTPNFTISQGLSDGRSTNTGNPNEFGDYIAIDFHAGTLVAAWADSSNSTLDNPNGTGGLDIYFAKVTVAVPETPPWATLALGVAALGWARRRAVGRGFSRLPQCGSTPPPARRSSAPANWCCRW